MRGVLGLVLVPLALGACTYSAPLPDLGGPTVGAEDLAPGEDGTPTRQACTSDFGSGLDSSHGRLDGLLVSIVAPARSPRCNADDSHVHLQVLMQGAIYDVAIDIGEDNDPISYLAKDAPLPDGAWAEGWHSGAALSYPALGVVAGDFASLDPDTAAAAVESALADVNHISVFGTGYGPDGMHLIHYENGQDEDGAVVAHPLSSAPTLLLFHFANDRF